MKGRILFHLLEDILNAIHNIERFVGEMDFQEFRVDEKTIRAIERELEIIGEAVKKIPRSLTDEYPEIPWRAIAGMRDRLIHHYWDIEVGILWKTIEESIPQLKSVISKMTGNKKLNSSNGC